jgi:hypothetical protein
MQLNVAAQVQQLQAQNSQQNTAVAMLAAREALQGGTFMSVMDRRRAEEGKAGKMVAQAMSALADQVAATRADDAVALVNSTRDALIAARESIVRAEFERDVDVSAESDAEFLRKVEALRTKCAAMPVFQRASFALELYRRALALADEGRQRLIEAALLPIATEMVMDGAARIRATVAAAGRAGNATKTLNDANSFVNKAVAQAKGRDGSDELAAARVVQGQLELCFLKTGGLDASDPASVSGAQFSNWMSGARKPMMLSADLAIDPKWLTRPMRSTSPTTMPPFQGPSAEIAVKAGKAGAR